MLVDARGRKHKREVCGEVIFPWTKTEEEEEEEREGEEERREGEEEDKEGGGKEESRTQ